MRVYSQVSPYTGQAVCGDYVEAFYASSGVWYGLVVDGLGHGAAAGRAAKQAVEEFKRRIESLSLEDCLYECDRRLRHTRGSALSVLMWDGADELVFAGVGNVSLLIGGRTRRTLQASPGILGAGFKDLVAHRIPKTADMWAILYTDGLRAQADAEFGAHLSDPEELTTRFWSTSQRSAADDAGTLAIVWGGDDN